MGFPSTLHDEQQRGTAVNVMSSKEHLAKIYDVIAGGGARAPQAHCMTKKG
jgi:hypothetical protein